MTDTVWTKEDFYAITEGFWATRVANGLTSASEAARRVRQQWELVDQLVTNG